MTQTLSSSAGTITPALGMLGYEAPSAVPTVRHELIGGGYSYTLQPARPRSGRLTFGFPTAAAAFAARTLLLSTPAVWSLADTAVPQLNLQLVIHDIVEPHLDPVTLVAWTLEFTYSEVVP